MITVKQQSWHCIQYNSVVAYLTGFIHHNSLLEGLMGITMHNL